MQPTQADGVTQTPENAVNSGYKPPMNRADFDKKYWFNSLQLVTVTNPKKDDYPFMVEMRHFVVRAGKTERLPGVIANVDLDQMSKILAQDDEKLSYMTDPNLLRVYYDKLIVDVESLTPEYNPVPEYLRNVPESAQLEVPDERPPWDAAMGERARDVAPNQTPDTSGIDEPPAAKPPKEETREFELEGAKYKMVVAKDGRKMYYKNGQLTGGDEYNKAASML